MEFLAKDQQDKVKEYNLIFDYVIQEAEKLNISKDIYISYSRNYNVLKCNDYCELLEFKILLNNISKENIEKFQILENKVYNDYKTTHIQYFNVSMIIQHKKGNKFLGISNIQNVMTGEKLNVSQKPGQVMAITFWRTCLGVSQIEYINKVFKENEQRWKNQIQKIAINYRDSLEETQSFVKFNYQQFEHFKFFDDEDPEKKYYDVTSLPIVLVSQNGNIAYCGFSQLIDLQDSIDKLIQGNNEIIKSRIDIQQQLQEKEEQQTFEHINKLTDQELDKIIITFKEKYQPFYEQQKTTVNVEFKQVKEFINGKIVKRNYPFYINNISYKHEMKDIENIKKIIYSYLNEKLIVDNSKRSFFNYDCKPIYQSLFKIYQNLNIKAVKLVLGVDFELRFKSNTEIEFIKNKTVKFERKITSEEFDPKQLFKIQYQCQNLENQLSFNKLSSLNLFDSIFTNGVDWDIVKRTFQPIQNLHEFGKQENITLQHNKGQIYIVDFFNHYSTDCINQIELFKKIMQDNKTKWNNKLAVYAVCQQEESESQIETIKKIINDDVKFYLYNNIDLSSIEKNYYSIDYGTSFPLTLIINQEGQIVFYGNLKDCNLEQKIQLLLEGKQAFETPKAVTENQQDNSQIYKKLRNYIKRSNSEAIYSILKDLQYDPELNFKWHYDKIISEGKVEKVIFSVPTFNAKMMQYDQQRFKDYIGKFFEGLNKDQYQLTEEFVSSIDVPVGDKCKFCKKKLDENTPHYWCKTTQQFLCKQCGDAKNPLEFGLKKFLHPHNLIFINIKGNKQNLKNISVLKIGDDIQPKDNEQAIEITDSQCEFCLTQIIGRRFVCLQCGLSASKNDRKLNLCQTCLDQQIDQSNPNFNEMQERLVNHQHKTDHLLLKILFNNGGYSNY